MGVRRNLFLFKLYFLFANIWPLSALAIVYFQQITGSYAIALGVFSIVNIVKSITVIPMGVVSDKIGRKKTIVLSSLFVTLAFLMFALAGSFEYEYLLFIGGLLWAISAALSAGTVDAMMYETMDDLHEADRYDIMYAHSETFSQVGLGLGAIIASVVVYFYSLITLAWFSVFLSVMQMLVAIHFVESRKVTKKRTPSIKYVKFALKAFLRNKKLGALAIIHVLNQSICNTTQRFEGAYFNLFIPTWMVNVARVIKHTCGMISYSVAPLFRKLGFFRILIASTLGSIIINLSAVIMNNVVTPFIQSCANILYGTSNTAESALIQKELSSRQRATMGAMVSFMGGIVSAAIYWIIGIIADMSSVWFAILMLILSKTIVAGGYYWMLKKYK